MRLRDRTTLLTGRDKFGMIIGSAVIMLMVMMVSISLGNLRIPLGDVVRVFGYKLGLTDYTASKTFITIVWDVRFPRICQAAFSGAALAVSGTVFQGIFRNPLVEPYILGISSGAACGAAIAIVYFQGVIHVSVLAFAFSVAAMAMAYGIATKRGNTPLVNLILAGVIVSSIFTAVLNLVKTVAPDSALREITFWLMGGFYTAKWGDAQFLLAADTVSIIILTALGWKLNVLSMGDQEASTLGVNAGRLKLAALGIATFVTASTVANVGIISWVGLMIPHVCRMLIGPDHRYLIPFSAFTGGFFLVICDTIARTVIMGELPISIITSVLGAPYIIYLLRTSRSAGM